MNSKKRKRLSDICINVSPEDNFTQVPNSVLRDPTMSANAKIALAILLSNRKGWKSKVETLNGMMQEGTTAIRSALAVLQKKGFLIRSRVRERTTKKTVGGVWIYSYSKDNMDMAKAIKQLKKNNLEIYYATNGRRPPKKHREATIRFPSCGSSTCGSATGINNNNKLKKIKKIKITRRPKGTPVDISKLTIKQRNAQYKPIARHLSRIVQSYKNLKPTPTQLGEWANQIRILVEGRGASEDRITKALDWYEKHYADKYVPVIESGFSLKNKFSNLEDAIKRDQVENGIDPEQGRPARPKQIIKDKMNGVQVGVTNSIIRSYEKAVDLMPQADQAELAQNLCNVYTWLVENKESNANTESARYKDRIGSTESVIGHYIYWLKKQDWIDNKAPRLFDGKAKLFQNFLRAESKERGTDILTGTYV